MPRFSPDQVGDLDTRDNGGQVETLAQGRCANCDRTAVSNPAAELLGFDLIESRGVRKYALASAVRSQKDSCTFGKVAIPGLWAQASTPFHALSTRVQIRRVYDFDNG